MIWLGWNIDSNSALLLALVAFNETLVNYCGLAVTSIFGLFYFLYLCNYSNMYTHTLMLIFPYMWYCCNTEFCLFSLSHFLL